MNKKATISFLLFIVFGNSSFSQINFRFVEVPKPFFVVENSNFSNMVFHISRPKEKVKSSFLLNPPPFSQAENSVSHYSDFEIPQGAIFCRMENKLRNTFNIWIKIRAGTDESYNFIKPQ